MTKAKQIRFPQPTKITKCFFFAFLLHTKISLHITEVMIYISLYKTVSSKEMISCFSFFMYNSHEVKDMRIISGINYYSKLETMIQECVKAAQDHPFEEYLFICDEPSCVEKMFLNRISYLINIRVLSWQDFLKDLQIEYHLTAHHVILYSELVYHLQHILKQYHFRCFETDQPYPLIDQLIPLLRELELSLTDFQNIDLSNQPKFVDYVNLQNYLYERLDEYTHLTMESLFKDIDFHQGYRHIYIEADHLFQPSRQDIIQRLSQYHDLTLLYTYHHDQRLMNLPYESLCHNAVEYQQSRFLSDNLFLQSPEICQESKELYTFVSPTPLQEVKRVVHMIYQKIVDEHLRYLDFVIVYPNSSYLDLLLRFLNECHIPHHSPIVESCQYDYSYQHILQSIDALSSMRVKDFAQELMTMELDADYIHYFETLLEYDDVMTNDEFKQFFVMTYKKNHQTINKNQDYVRVCSIEEVRVECAKHIYILGMNETILPRFIKDTSLLLNEDITFLRQRHVSTPLSTMELLGVHENDILKALLQPYLSMTFSYSTSTLSGETLLPSSLYKQLNKMYQFKKAVIPTYVSLDDFYSQGGQMDTKDIINQHIHHYLETKNQPVSLDESTVKDLYSSTMSVSQMETYNQCPFLYFIQYGLGIYPLKDHQLKSNELGSLVHYVLSKCIKKDDDIDSLVESYLNKNEELKTKVLASKINIYFIDQLKQDLVITIRVLKHILDTSLFDISAQEKKIEDDILGIHFKGFVDRIDVYKNYVSIIDYKSSQKDIDLNLAMQGFHIQMLVYLKMITKIYQKDPAAVLYFNTKRRVLSSSQSFNEDIDQNDLLDLYRYGGYVIDDDHHEIITSLDPSMDRKSHIINVTYVKKNDSYKGHILTPSQLDCLLKEIENHIYELYSKMMNGCITITPKGSDQSTVHTQVNPCRYCSYHSICQFDVFYNDYDLVQFYNVEEKLGGNDNAI